MARARLGAKQYSFNISRYDNLLADGSMNVRQPSFDPACRRLYNPPCRSHSLIEYRCTLYDDHLDQG